jgi:hypothetical protein
MYLIKRYLSKFFIYIKFFIYFNNYNMLEL